MKMNSNELNIKVFFQGVLNVLVNAVYSCVCIHSHEDLITNTEEELDELASNYNQIYINLGELIGKKIHHWNGENVLRWSRNFLSYQANVRTLLSVLSLTYLHFVEQVSASSMVLFYRYAPGNSVMLGNLPTNSFSHILNVKSFSINHLNSSHLKVAAVFFVFNKSTVSRLLTR